MTARTCGDTVIKLGGSVLRDEADYRRIADTLQPWTRRGAWIVVSAAQGVTDELERLARTRSTRHLEGLVAHHNRLGGSPVPSELVTELACAAASTSDPSALMLSWGERASAWALREHLRSLGTDMPVAELPSRGLPPVSAAIVPGFYVRDRHGRFRLLPRGGSDISAVLLASRLHAREVRLWKDGGGIRSLDNSAQTLSEADGYELMSRLQNSTRPLHPAALRLALMRGLDLILEDPLGRHSSTLIRGLVLDAVARHPDHPRPEANPVVLAPPTLWGRQ